MKRFPDKNSREDKPQYTLVAVSILFIFLLISIFLLPISRNFVKNITSRIAMYADVLSSELVLETNSFRSMNRENALVQNQSLMKAAQLKAEDMAKREYFSHIDPDGNMPWVWFDKVGYKYDYAGENLAVDFTESADVTEGWINSAKHKANILNSNFTEIGVGVAKGVYEGHQTTYVVQFFGSPFGNNSVTAPDKLAQSSSKLSISTIPTLPIATRSDLANGMVLGEQTNTASEANGAEQIATFLIGLALLFAIFSIFKSIFKKNGGA